MDRDPCVVIDPTSSSAPWGAGFSGADRTVRAAQAHADPPMARYLAVSTTWHIWFDEARGEGVRSDGWRKPVSSSRAVVGLYSNRTSVASGTSETPRCPNRVRPEF